MSAVEHPAPARGTSPLWLQLLVLALPVAAWIGAELVGYGVSSYACFPSTAPHQVAPPPGWADEKPWLVGAHILALIACAGSFAIAYGTWRRTRHEKKGGAETMAEVGEGRASFLALCACFTAVGFGAVILFTATALLVVPSCWEFRA